MPMTAKEITRRITDAIPDAEVELVDLAGDDDHWQVTVISESFQNLSRVQQHQAVFAAFGEDMGTTLHALSVKTRAK